MEELMEYFFSENLRLCQMASFPMIVIGDEASHLLVTYLEKMVDHYRNAPHNAFRRNVMRLFQFIEIPEELEGKVYDLCMEDFCNTKMPTAIRVFALTSMCNICAKHPDIAFELLPILKDFKGTGTTGFENRLNKEIIRVSKLASE